MDKIAELQKLKQLLDDGLITKVEYDALKAEIIGANPPEEPKKEAPVPPPAPVEPEEVIPVEPVAEAPKEPLIAPSAPTPTAPKKNKKVLIGVLIGVGIIAIGLLVKIVFFPPAPIDDSLVDDTIVVDDDSDIMVDDEVDDSPITMTPSASSSIPASTGLDYSPTNAIDGNLKTWWTPKRNPQGEEWLKIQFSRTTYLSSIKIHGGAHYPDYTYKEKNYGDLFYLNLRVKRARLEFSDGSSQIISLRDEDFIQEIVLDESVSSSYVKIIPLTSYLQVGGWDDYCISEVSFTF